MSRLGPVPGAASPRARGVQKHLCGSWRPHSGVGRAGPCPQLTLALLPPPRCSSPRARPLITSESLWPTRPRTVELGPRLVCAAMPRAGGSTQQGGQSRDRGRGRDGPVRAERDTEHNPPLRWGERNAPERRTDRQKPRGQEARLLSAPGDRTLWGRLGSGLRSFPLLGGRPTRASSKPHLIASPRDVIRSHL